MQFVELLAEQKGVTRNKVFSQILQRYLYQSLADYCHEVQKVEQAKGAAEKQQSLKFDDDVPF